MFWSKKIRIHKTKHFYKKESGNIGKYFFMKHRVYINKIYFISQVKAILTKQ